jgi:hypothetical protein
MHDEAHGNQYQAQSVQQVARVDYASMQPADQRSGVNKA